MTKDSFGDSLWVGTWIDETACPAPAGDPGPSASAITGFDKDNKSFIDPKF